MTIQDLVAGGIKDGVFPGCAWAFGNARTSVSGYAGAFSYDPGSREVDGTSTWDLASMTKVLSTATVALRLVNEGAISLDDLVAKHVPQTRLEGATLQNLLLHDSGLAAYDQALASEVSSPDEARERILAATPEAPTGSRTTYSCLGFVTLQAVLEKSSGVPLDRLFQGLVAEPLGLSAARYNPTEPRVCPPTGPVEPWRTGVVSTDHLGFVQGCVHDPIAWRLGGVSGNAGLFAPLDDVTRFAQTLLNQDPVFGRALPQFTRVSGEASTRALGWDTNRDGGISAGSKFSPRSFGHTGFTGTALWVDPEAGVFATLLTNRVHPDPENTQILAFRPNFFDLAWTKAKGLS